LKKRFGGVLIANEGFNQETAQQVIAVGGADAVSIGKDYISNPDLVLRLQLNVALSPYLIDTFYNTTTQNSRTGYTDYPS
jgi:N-ethylmaleimide reductase